MGTNGLPNLATSITLRELQGIVRESAGVDADCRTVMKKTFAAVVRRVPRIDGAVCHLGQLNIIPIMQNVRFVARMVLHQRRFNLGGLVPGLFCWTQCKPLFFLFNKWSTILMSLKRTDHSSPFFFFFFFFGLRMSNAFTHANHARISCLLLVFPSFLIHITHRIHS
jgi:hypothetical protein